MVDHGNNIHRWGALERASQLSRKQRSSIASKAASTRWSGKEKAASITPEMTKRQQSQLQNRISKVRYNKKVPP